jgi:TPR repeat protein
MSSMDGVRALRSPAFAEVRFRLALAEEDPVKSAEWLRAAALHDHAAAHRTMGGRLREGLGVEKDIPASTLSVRKAAELGDREVGSFSLIE